MANEVRLPQLGQTMEEGTVVDCLIKLGDEVKKGDVIFEIETDKATLEIESPIDGFVKHILVEVGQTLPVGKPLLVLGDKDEQVSQSFLDSLKAAATGAEPPQAVPTAGVKTAKPELQPKETAAKSIASPRAKKLAKELGINLADITGTGPAGKITEDDVKKAASLTPPTPVAAATEVKLGDTIPLQKKQRLTAERMVKSKREIPCFYLTVKADVTDLVELRTKLNASSSAKVKISYNDFIIKAVATSLEKFPIMTGQLVGDSIKLADAIHVGLAISVPDGLVAPVIKVANKKNVTQIAQDSQTLIERARNNKLAPIDLEGGCITVSNLGSLGIDSFIPIVVPGQCSILGIGRITDTCVPENGNVIIRRLMNMTLAADHKVVNGAYAAQFLDSVRKLLEDASSFSIGSW